MTYILSSIQEFLIDFGILKMFLEFYSQISKFPILFEYTGCFVMEQKILRLDQQQPDWGFRQLLGIHSISHDPSQRANEGNPSSGSGTLSHHYECPGLSGKHWDWIQGLQNGINVYQLFQRSRIGKIFRLFHIKKQTHPDKFLNNLET